jgi:hypothetical protein
MANLEKGALSAEALKAFDDGWARGDCANCFHQNVSTRAMEGFKQSE